jgi:hypothetical protein
MGMVAKGSDAVLRFEMNDASLKRKLAELSADSFNVLVLPHAKRRM